MLKVDKGFHSKHGFRTFTPHESTSVGIAKGLAHGSGELLYDWFKVGTTIGNTITPADGSLDIGTDYWNAMEMLGIDTHNVSNTTKITSKMSSMMITTLAGMSALSSARGALPTLANGDKAGKLATLAHNLKLGTAADILTSVVHSAQQDTSVFELIPKESRPDFLRWFVDRDDDTKTDIVLKNIVEGMFLGGVFEVGALGLKASVTSFMGAFKTTKKAAHVIADEGGSSVATNLDRFAGKGDGALATDVARTTTIVGQILGDSLQPNTRLWRQGSSAIENSEPMRHVTKGEKLAKDMVEATGGAPVNAKRVAGRQDFIESYTTDLQQAIQKAQRVLGDPNATEEALAKAKALMNIYDTHLTNPFNGGAHSAAAAKAVGEHLETAGLITKASRRRTHLGIAQVAESKFKKGTLGVPFARLKDVELAGDAKGVQAQLMAFESMYENAEEVFMKGIGLMDEKYATVTATIKEYAKSKGSPEDKIGLLKRLADELLEHDTLQAGLTGTSSFAGRTLNMTRIQNSSASEMLASMAEEFRLDRIGKKVEEGAENFWISVATAAKSGDVDLLKVDSAIKRIAKKGTISRKDLDAMLKAKTLTDYFESHFIGSLLGGIKTVTGSVGIANAMSSAWKQIVVPTVAGFLNTARHTGLIADSGHRITTGLYNAVAMVDAAYEATKKMYQSGNNLSDLMYTGGGRVREGVDLGQATVKELEDQFKITAKFYDDNNMYVKATVAQMAAPLMSRTIGVQNFFVRGIQGMDEYFKAINLKTSFKAEARLAWDKSGGEALLGSASKKYPAFEELYTGMLDEMGAITQKFANNTRGQKAAIEEFLDSDLVPNGMKEELITAFKRSQDTAHQVALQQETGERLLGGKFFDWLSNVSAKSVGGRTALMLTFPFRKTPVNVLSEIIAHSPLALTSKRMRDVLLKKGGDPTERMNVLAQVAAASGLSLAFMSLASEGRIVGSIAPEKRARAEAQGKREMSILIGDTYYSFKNMGPMAAYLASAADGVNLLGTDPDATTASVIGQALALGVEESHLSTLKELIEATTDENVIKSLSKLGLDKVTGSLVPLRGSLGTLDDLLSDTKSVSSVDREVGGLAQELLSTMHSAIRLGTAHSVFGENAFGFTNDKDILGRDVRKYSNTLSGKALHLLGIGNSTAHMDEVTNELVRHNLLPTTKTGRTVEGVALTGSERRQLDEAAYQGSGDLNQILNSAVNSNTYQLLSRSAQKRYLQQLMESSVSLVKDELYASSGRIQLEKQAKDLFKFITETQEGSRGELAGIEQALLAEQDSRITNSQNKVTMKDFADDWGLYE